MHLANTSFAMLMLLSSRTTLSGQAPRDTDPTLLSAIDRVLNAKGRSAEVWPSFASPDEFVLCQRSDLTLVVTRRERATQIEGASELPLSGHSQHHLLSYPGRLTGLPPNCFSLRFRLAEQELLSFPALDSAYSIRGTAPATTVAVLHEWFHAFQRSTFTGTRGASTAWAFDVHEAGESPPSEVLTSQQFQALATAERQLLARALEAATTDSVRLLLRRYIEQRAARMRMLAPELRGIEPHEERKEGTAQYTAYRSALAMNSSDERIVLSTLAQDLRTPLDFANGAWRSWHIYATGAALGVLLDRLGCSWKTAVSEGETLFGLVARAVDFDADISDVVSTVPPLAMKPCRQGILPQEPPTERTAAERWAFGLRR